MAPKNDQNANQRGTQRGSARGRGRGRGRGTPGGQVLFGVTGPPSAASPAAPAAPSGRGRGTPGGQVLFGVTGPPLAAPFAASAAPSASVPAGLAGSSAQPAAPAGGTTRSSTKRGHHVIQNAADAMQTLDTTSALLKKQKREQFDAPRDIQLVLVDGEPASQDPEGLDLSERPRDILDSLTYAGKLVLVLLEVQKLKMKSKEAKESFEKGTGEVLGSIHAIASLQQRLFKEMLRKFGEGRGFDDVPALKQGLRQAGDVIDAPTDVPGSGRHRGVLDILSGTDRLLIQLHEVEGLTTDQVHRRYVAHHRVPGGVVDSDLRLSDRYQALLRRIGPPDAPFPPTQLALNPPNRQQITGHRKEVLNLLDGEELLLLELVQRGIGVSSTAIVAEWLKRTGQKLGRTTFDARYKVLQPALRQLDLSVTTALGPLDVTDEDETTDTEDSPDHSGADIPERPFTSIPGTQFVNYHDTVAPADQDRRQQKAGDDIPDASDPDALADYQRRVVALADQKRRLAGHKRHQGKRVLPDADILELPFMGYFDLVALADQNRRRLEAEHAVRKLTDPNAALPSFTPPFDYASMRSADLNRITVKGHYLRSAIKRYASQKGDKDMARHRIINWYEIADARQGIRPGAANVAASSYHSMDKVELAKLVRELGLDSMDTPARSTGGIDKRQLIALLLENEDTAGEATELAEEDRLTIAAAFQELNPGANLGLYNAYNITNSSAAIFATRNGGVRAPSDSFGRLENALAQDFRPNTTSNNGLLCGPRALINSVNDTRAMIDEHANPNRVGPLERIQVNEVLARMFRNFDPAAAEASPGATQVDAVGIPTDEYIGFLRNR
ncbi:hypothetical protein LTR27_002083 [Elasticomyces elasticus]|nr:hypothetical protein LTR27_002083 [Elasticomyces elasticus]